MKTIILIICLCFNTILWGEEITDFNSPLWNYGTGNGADATGAGTLGGISFNMAFSLNGGTKLFTSTAKHTSNSTLGHGGPLGSLLLSGSGEGLSITFATPMTVILGFSHVNVATDGWDFITPANEIASLHSEHAVYEVVPGSGSLDGVRQKGPTNANLNSISYFKWNNVTTINLQTVGSSGTTLAFSSMATAPTPEITLQKISQTLSDPVNGNTSPKAIPGSLAEYTIAATNSGMAAADNNTIIITDAIPANTALYVNDISGAGTGPIRFVNGTPSSGLSYTYTSLGSTTDGLSFSNNGGTTYTYVPSPDAYGVDTNVTNIRIATIGQFLASGGAGNPSFSLLFRVKVK